MANQQAICEVLGIEDETTEDSLYNNLSWLMKQQGSIEKKLFSLQHKTKPVIFLYDVTSSYFEGKKNEMADWGYNRDRKNGKMQVVAGLLCDEKGNPMAIRLFKGNTLDFNTVSPQIKQIARDFGCERITFVGDRGMIKSKQMEELEAVDFFYITAITKTQIASMINNSTINMSLFDSEIKEVSHEGIRYILKRNPVRVEELNRTRQQKKAKAEKLCKAKNIYLKEHPRAKPETAIRGINVLITKLKIDKWLHAELSNLSGRELVLVEDGAARKKEAEFDGCYVVKSNLPEEVGKEIIHRCYKDLSLVEQGFRCLKTDFLEMRPWYVRKEGSTRGHALVVMLAYMIVKYLREAWESENIKVEEGIKSMNSLSLLEVNWNDEIKYYEVPEPNDQIKRLLDLAGVKLPDKVPYKKVNVYCRVKLVRKA
jgi:transposase